MGLPKKPQKVRLFVTTLSSEECLLDLIKIRLIDRFGEIAVVGNMHRWNYSPAYSEELGGNIQRRILVFKELQNPEDLADWKLTTINLEQQYLSTSAAAKRRINLDPGYISCTHVILASTKQYGNRVYLREGIYADLTLNFDGEVFKPFMRWTLPDYKTRAITVFFAHQRTLLRCALHKCSEIVQSADSKFDGK